MLMGEQGFHICAYCIQYKYSNLCTNFGELLYFYLNTLLVVVSFWHHLMVFQLFLLDLLIARFICWSPFLFFLFFLLSLGPQYSFTSSLVLIIWLVHMHTFGGILTMLTVYNFSPILAIDANGGEVLEGLREVGLCFECVLKHLPLMLLHLCCCFACWIYRGNSTNDNGWQSMQWNSSSSHMHRLWGSLLYILWLYQHHILV